MAKQIQILIKKRLSATIDTSREIKVQFVATKNSGMTWDFAPSIPQITGSSRTGGRTGVYCKKSHENVASFGQAIPSVTPFEATNFLHKVECFCFTTQTLDPQEEKVMPLRIIVDQELPKHIKKLTLSYTLFDVTHLGERTLKALLIQEIQMANEGSYYVPAQSKWPIIASIRVVFDTGWRRHDDE